MSRSSHLYSIPLGLLWAVLVVIVASSF
jgi:hypothetical protein